MKYKDYKQNLGIIGKPHNAKEAKAAEQAKAERLAKEEAKAAEQAKAE